MNHIITLMKKGKTWLIPLIYTLDYFGNPLTRISNSVTNINSNIGTLWHILEYCSCTKYNKTRELEMVTAGT